MIAVRYALTLVLGCVVQLNARNGKRQIRGRAHYGGDARRDLTLPVRSDDHVEAGLGAVLLADPADFIRAVVVDRIDPETFAKVRHLEHHRLLVQRSKSPTVYYVLVGADDEGLLRADVVVQHREFANGGHG